MKNKKLIYITGSGHSGSTLLDLLLNGHTHITGLGEVHRFSISFGHDIQPLKCSCGDSITQCQFWKRVVQTLIEQQYVSQNSIRDFITTTAIIGAESGTNDYLSKNKKKPRYVLSMNRFAMLIGSKRLWRILSIISEDVERNIVALTNSLILFDIIRKLNNSPIIIDSTKNPSRLKGFDLLCGDGLFIIHLIRDGRAVCYSRMKRENISMEESVKIWVAEQKKLNLILSRINESNVMRVSYEDLCENTNEVLINICSYLDINFQQSMLAFRNNVSHSLGGNPMRFSLKDQSIVLREDWKDGLSKDDKSQFNKIAGRINRKYGYI